MVVTGFLRGNIMNLQEIKMYGIFMSMFFRDMQIMSFIKTISSSDG